MKGRRYRGRHLRAKGEAGPALAIIEADLLEELAKVAVSMIVRFPPRHSTIRTAEEAVAAARKPNEGARK